MNATRGWRFLGRGLTLGVALALALGVAAATPQSTSGTFLVIETESDGQPPRAIEISLGPDRMRMNMGEEMSLISIGGDDGKMLMVQHAQRMYIEFTAETMRGLAGIMGGQMPPGIEEIEEMTPPTFVRTGNTKQVGSWNAYEVRVEHPEQDGEMSMWFSQEVDADFRALVEQMVESMQSLLQNPMLQRMQGGGDNPMAMVNSIRAQLNAVEMPDGFPVQIVSNEGGSQSTNTLKAIEQGASFDASTWEAPAGYQKMQMPFRR